MGTVPIFNDHPIRLSAFNQSDYNIPRSYLSREVFVLIKKYARPFALLSIIIATILIVCGCPEETSGSRGGNRKPTDLSRKKAPDFTATTIDGERISLSDYSGKKAVLVDIWATWCGPCKMEMPILQKIYEKYSDKLEIIGASIDDPNKLPDVKKFVKEKNISFKIIHDTSREIARKYPSAGIPFLTVVDIDGNIIKTFYGFSPNIASEIEKILEL